MLEFAKNYVHGEDKSLDSAGSKTYFAITNDGHTMIATRIVFMKAKRLVFSLDGTIGGLAKRVNTTVKILDSDFAMFSDVQFAAELSSDYVV